MKCPNCGYGAPVIRYTAKHTGEWWWWLECSQCGYMGRAARTEEQDKKNLEEEAKI